MMMTTPRAKTFVHFLQGDSADRYEFAESTAKAERHFMRPRTVWINLFQYAAKTDTKDTHIVHLIPGGITVPAGHGQAA